MGAWDWLHDPTDSFPSEWEAHLQKIAVNQSEWSRDADVLRMKAWMLWEEIGHRYVIAENAARAAKAVADAADAQATAANRHASALKFATWVLAGATTVLAIATIGLWVVTAQNGG